MKSVTSPGSSKRSSLRWWAAAVVLLLTSAGFLAVGFADRGEPLAGPAATPRASHPAADSLLTQSQVTSEIAWSADLGDHRPRSQLRGSKVAVKWRRAGGSSRSGSP